MKNENIFKFGTDIATLGITMKIATLFVPEQIREPLRKYSDPYIICGSIIALSQQTDVIKDAIVDFFKRHREEWE